MGNKTLKKGNIMKKDTRVWLSIVLTISALITLLSCIDWDTSLTYFVLSVLITLPFVFSLLFCTLTAIDLLLHPTRTQKTRNGDERASNGASTDEVRVHPKRDILTAASVACAFLWMVFCFLIRCVFVADFIYFIFFTFIPVILSTVLWCIGSLSPKYNNGEMRPYAALATVGSAAIGVLLILSVFGHV